MATFAGRAIGKDEGPAQSNSFIPEPAAEAKAQAQ